VLKFLLVVAIFAAVTYYVTRRLQDRVDDAPAPRRPTRPTPPARPVAPDDDEEFLRDIERRRRRNPPDKDAP
jgi:hypothetical protein